MYLIYFSFSGVPDFSVFRDDIPPSLTNFEVGGLRSGTEYLFRVAASNDIGQGSFSSVLGGVTLDRGEIKLFNKGNSNHLYRGDTV